MSQNSLPNIENVKKRFGIIGTSPLLNRAVEVAIQVAPTQLSVLIQGENGSGKESFSKLLHELSPYKHGKFIAVNCGAIPEGTIDSELFGHVRGAFTGAEEIRKGYFEEANGGTIFLDEIGELPFGAQARLLRVLETGEFIKVGSSTTQKTDVRVVAATHKALREAVAKGSFREDLYYRINTIPLFIPPLRKRGTDILLLWKKFTTDFAIQYSVQPLQLSKEAEVKLLQYPFPGNIRQLKNLAMQISLLEHKQPVISAATLANYLPLPMHHLPAIAAGASTKQESYPPQELLWKCLWELQGEVQRLKQFLYAELSSDKAGKELAEKYAPLFKNLQKETAWSLAPLAPPVRNLLAHHTPTKQDNTTTKPVTEENLSLEAKEKELLAKALKKYGERRKEVAKALGISERSVYRKIKQYKLEPVG